MINLLPLKTKKQIRAARTNSVLIYYIFILAFAVAFLTIYTFRVYGFLSENKSTSSAPTDSEQIELSNNLNQLKSQANIINTNISNAKEVMNQQISYSSIIMAIAEALPSGVKLDELSLNSKNLNSGSPITFRATAPKDTDVAVLGAGPGFQKNPIFSYYNLVSSEKDLSNGTYAILISVNINKDMAK